MKEKTGFTFNRTITGMFIILLLVTAVSVYGNELDLDHKREVYDLAGEWEMLADNGDAEAWNWQVGSALGTWRKIEVPKGTLLVPETDDEAGWKKMREEAKKMKSVWVRRTFDVSQNQAAKDAVLKWGGIKFGVSAWVNGTFVKEHNLVCPAVVVLPKGILKKGENEILLKVACWEGIPKNEKGYPFRPVGAATQPWGGKIPAVYDDIYLEFYKDVYLKNVLSMPNTAESTVGFRIALDSNKDLPSSVDIKAEVFEKGGSKSIAEGAMNCSPKEVPMLICSIKNQKLWTIDTPFLYEVLVKASVNGKICDDMSFTFGMRDLKVENSRFKLNGKTLWLRGSNMVNEWGWGPVFTENAKKYMIDLAKLMNLNVFRTHTVPPPAWWTDIAD